ncbi:phosphatase PAP2 family protein [Kineosporia sp. J2-2]|uniref:Phosphatase PAP2 family protein n=1 Tax=Kineosporia corallincola TaxID=2835133 RepID=A0ABS5TEF8_9ACTN|nr:phosphatase PAP2 family protein [Kineosporia corallincola]MBT0769238.1 phosphatase PAP2 family protein [Kineosporia corallincola]
MTRDDETGAITGGTAGVREAGHITSHDLTDDAPPEHEGRLVLAGLLLFLGTTLLGGFVLILVLVATVLPEVPEIDQDVSTGLHGYVLDRPLLGDVLTVIGHLTEPFVIRAVFLVLAVLLWRRGARRAVAWMAATLVIGGVLNPLIKLLVDRTRPDLPDPIYLASGSSFPSGHTTNAVMFAGIVLVLLEPSLRHHVRLPSDGRSVRGTGGRVALWLAALLFPVFVALDRLGLGVHYLTDVVGGYFFGLSVLMITLVAFSRSSTLQLWPRRQPAGPKN